ncbi:DUF4276 family protein [Plantibacter sp. M259]|uniref:DUF4276 family protein n=1 Tax=Plantibacter sp. M259 TaxID=2583822 RepID=UPI00143CEE2A|nr:DUF4276 family protein [Plantibacter sp. M259]
MTANIAILVEGQTEEAFVSRVLQPYLGYDVAYLTPIVVHTSRSANGTAFRGGGKWRHYHDHLQRLLAESHWSLITTLIDYYGYPSDAPTCSCLGAHGQPACVVDRERSIREAFHYDHRFAPFLALHEFETLIIAAGGASSEVLGDKVAATEFRRLIDGHGGNAELINDGVATAPSKRVLAAIPGYSKVLDGVAILEDRLDSALVNTPRFNDWVSSLRAAGSP